MTAPTVTLYTKDRCVQCNASKLKLKKEGVVYETVDLTAAYADIAPADEVAAAKQTVEAIRELGHQQMPVIIVSRPGEEDVHWSGHIPDNIMKHCKTTAS